MPQLTVKLLKAENLFDTDLLSKLDPYVTMRLGGNDKKSSNVNSNAGTSFVFNQKQEFTWNYALGSDPTLSFKTMDKDMFSKDDLVGKCAVNILGLENGVYEGPLHLFNGVNDEHAGTLYVKITTDIKPDDIPVPRPAMVLLAAKIHRNAFLGAISTSNTVDGHVSFDTYEVRLEKVPHIFGDRWQCNYDEEHAPMFADNAAGAAIRAALSTEHALFYRDGIRPNWLRAGTPRTTLSWIGAANDFVKLVESGVRSNVRRVFTYALRDEGLCFSETGIEMSKDIISKHAVHANGATRVRYSGTFRFVFDPRRPSDPILVIDNDSGTYRPSANEFEQLKRVLTENLPGLKVIPLSVLNRQPEDMKKFIGPCEVENSLSIPRVYPGNWIWDFSKEPRTEKKR